MNWPQLPLSVWEVAIHTIEFAVHWLLQSSFLLGIGLCFALLLRQKGSAVQSAIYRTTLVAVLVCPLASWGLARLGISGWSVPLPWISNEWSAAEFTAAAVSSDPQSPFYSGGPTRADQEGFVADALMASPTMLQIPPPVTDPYERTAEVDAATTDASTEARSAAVPVPTRAVELVVSVLLFAWIFGSLYLLLRLASAWRQMNQLRRQAVPAESRTVKTCHDLAASLGVVAPNVLRSPWLPSPCLAGLRHPAILLPEEDQGLSIREVLVHELAHLKRHDCHWSLVRQVATSIFFFQPLLWRLSRCLETTAEEVCDDYVVQLGGDRHEYARRLVDIAELSTVPIAAAGVGIVSLRSMLARRVARILDTSRALSTRIGGLIMVGVLLGGLIGTTIAGLVGHAQVPFEPESIEAGADEDLGSGDSPTLQLVPDDVPVRGRIIDLEGNAVAGVTVRISRLSESADRNLDSWLSALRNGEVLWEASSRYLSPGIPLDPGIPATMITDADGRFEIHGIGGDRSVGVCMEGPNIAYSEARIVTRLMEPIVANDGIPHPGWAKKSTVYGAECEITVSPTQPIVGTVRDAETGQPLADVAVESYRMSENGTSAQRLIRVATDQHGRFRLVGMPKGPGKQIIAVPNDDQCYLMRQFDVPDEPGLDPIEVDLELHRGIWLTGRVTEESTGKPVQARIHYLPYLDNLFAQALPEFESGGNVHGYQERYVTSADGHYRVVGLPGRAIVGVQCTVKDFPRGMGHEEIDGLDEEGHFRTYRNPIAPGRLWPNAMKEIDVAPDDGPVELHFQLHAGRTVRINIVDNDNREIAGVRVNPRSVGRPIPLLAGTTFDLTSLVPGDHRTLLFHHESRQLGKALRIAVNDELPSELTAKLDRCASVRGQVVDGNGRPISGARIRLHPLPWGDFTPELKWTATDQEGRFQHDAVLPGANYGVLFESAEHGLVSLASELQVRGGASIDLGAIDVTTDERPDPMRMELDSDDAATSSTEGVAPIDVVVIRGQVLGPDGLPFEGATVYAPKFLSEFPTSSADMLRVPRAQSDRNGQFEFEYDRAELPASNEMRRIGIVAYAKGYGVSSTFLDQDTRQAEVTMHLVADHPIRGRVLDTEGRPVAGVHVGANTIMHPEGEQLQEFLQGWSRQWREAIARIQNRIITTGSTDFCRAITDSDGRFEIHGVGKDRIAWMYFSEGGIARSIAFVVTKEGEDYSALNTVTTLANLATSMMSDEPSVKLYGPEFDYIVEPGKIIEGVVRDIQSGDPIADVHVSCYLGWDAAAIAITDADGKYQLTGVSKRPKYMLAARPSRDAGWVRRVIHVGDNNGVESLSVDIELARGVVITGHVIDRTTGQPTKADLRFVPIHGSTYFDKPGYEGFMGDGTTQMTDGKGKFRIVAIPGPGVIAARANHNASTTDAVWVSPFKRARISEEDSPFVTILTNQGLEYFTRADGAMEFMVFHSMKYLDIDPNQDSVNVDLYVERGTKRDVQLVDEQDEPVPGALATGLSDDFWPHIVELPTNECRVDAIDANQNREVAFFHPQRELSATVTVTDKESDPHAVRLRPARHLLGRLIDPGGNAIADTTFETWYDDMPTKQLERHLLLSRGFLKTDGGGRFEFPELPPGATFRIAIRSGNSFSISPTIDVRNAEATTNTIELGDITIGDRRNASASVTPNTESRSTPNKDDAKVLRGTVVGPDGQPASRVHIAVPATRIETLEDGEVNSPFEILGEGITNDRQEEELVSMTGSRGKADAQGRYRMSARPGIRFGITAFPPAGSPYLAHTTPQSEFISWEARERIMNVDVALPRGVMVYGKVVEADSVWHPVNSSTWVTFRSI